MPYLGNEAAEKFVSKPAVDQFSGDGSTTAFTLSFPVASDQDILVSVDGVIQDTAAYAVSNSTTLTFTAAPSSNSGNNIFVNYLARVSATIAHPSTSALTATTGTFTDAVTAASTLAVTGATTLTGEVTESQASVDFWRLSANYTSSGTDITGWERPDDGYNASVNGLTVSSGVFTFTKTGLYKFDVVVQGQNETTADGSFGVTGRVSTNSGGAYDIAGVAYNGDTDTGGNNGASFQFMVNVTDISTFRVKFMADSLASGTFITGSSTQNYTCFSSIKLAPAQ
jgi:hypothetical protein